MCVIYVCESVSVCACKHLCVCESASVYVRVQVCMCVCNTKTKNGCQVKIMEYLATCSYTTQQLHCVLVHVTTRSKRNASHLTWLLGRFLLA